MKFLKPGRQTILIAAVIIVVPVLLAVSITGLKEKYKSLPVYGEAGINTSKSTEHHVQPFTLEDQDGKTFTLADIKNKIVVVDFFFTSCTSVCPKMTMALKDVADAFRDDDNVALISFTVDPETDDPARLKWYIHQLNISSPHWTFLTGDKPEIYRLARRSFFLTASDGDGGPNDFIHSDKLVLIDKEKRVRGYYTGTDEKAVKQLMTDIKKLKYEK
ncbi:MAG TPA: SCO family protein [Parafilimonas sp.]|nr:SCO family protein [Parafilimonas sp.]